MIFRQLFDASSSTYSYIVGDEITREAIIIDPVLEQVDRDLQLLKDLKMNLVYTLDTHIHADHITGAHRLRQWTGCKIINAATADLTCTDIKFFDGDTLQFGNIWLKAIATPGHTPESMSFLTQMKLFTGDALLIRGCGRTDLQGGDAAVLYETLQHKLCYLPAETIVYPGHDYRGHLVSTIGEERQFNPRLQLSKAEFIDTMAPLNLSQPARLHEAIKANRQCGRI
jgi:sulfur dioxygenase